MLVWTLRNQQANEQFSVAKRLSGCKRVGKYSLMGLKSPCLVGRNHSVKRFFAQTREGRFDGRDAGTAVGQGGKRKWRAMEAIKKQKSPYQLCLLLFRHNVDLKNITEIIENRSEFSGCANSCNKFVSNRF